MEHTCDLPVPVVPTMATTDFAGRSIIFLMQELNTGRHDLRITWLVLCALLCLLLRTEGPEATQLALTLKTFRASWGKE